MREEKILWSTLGKQVAIEVNLGADTPSVLSYWSIASWENNIPMDMGMRMRKDQIWGTLSQARRMKPSVKMILSWETCHWLTTIQAWMDQFADLTPWQNDQVQGRGSNGKQPKM